MPNRATWIGKVKAAKEVIGVTVLVCGVLATVANFAFDYAMNERDARISEMGREIKMLTDSNLALSEAIEVLSSRQGDVRDAVRERFRHNELVDAEIQGSLNNLKTEVRVWHRVDPSVYGATSAPARIRNRARETDRSLTRVENAMPQNNPLSGL